MLKINYTGDIANITNNIDSLYQGDLRAYLPLIFTAPNIDNPYHGLRHMLHVMWVCYQACKYYEKHEELTPLEMRLLLIAALFHDYGHCGKLGDDSVNIAVAIKALHKHVLPVDQPHLPQIIKIIESTEFKGGHTVLPPDASLMEKIIRDADLGQAFSDTWLETVICGLGKEWGKTPIEMLEAQPNFLLSIKYNTTFAQHFYGARAIDEKCSEAAALLEIFRSAT